jgi:ABC-2 type transport system permease protein
MNAFLRKEFIENIRTYKLLIMFTVFILFGILSPLTAKLLPQILSSFMPEGISITLAEPAAIDAWTQFFKNISQIGIIVTVILFSGNLSNELSKGTLINMLTKGLKRSSVILAKYAMASILFTASYAAAAALSYVYTLYLFDGSELHNLLLSLLCLWLFGLFLLSVLMLWASITRSGYAALLLTGFVAASLMILNIIPAAETYNPISLAANNVALLTNAIEPYQIYMAGGIAIAGIIVFITGAVLVFQKKQL